MPPPRCGLVHSTAVDVGGRCDVAAGRAALAPGDGAPGIAAQVTIGGAH
jgi:hypothetical protein